MINEKIETLRKSLALEPMERLKKLREETDEAVDAVTEDLDIDVYGVDTSNAERSLTAERDETDRLLAEKDKEIATLTRERDIANLALRDLAEGAELHQCLVARPHEGILACRIDGPNLGCHACRIAGTIATLTRERDEARAEAAQLQEILISYGKLHPPRRKGKGGPRCGY